MQFVQPLALRIFISSPGDLAVERDLARKVIAALQDSAVVRRSVRLEPVLWDDEHIPVPLAASERPQASVNRYKGEPAECDLTVVILWAKIGSPPGAGFLRRDGKAAASGTDWEYENALSGRGDVWVYRRTAPHQTDYGAGQRDAVEQFFARMREEKRSVTGEFADPVQFERQFRKHLEAWIEMRLDTPAFDKPFVVTQVSRNYPIVGRDALVEEVWALLMAGKSASLHFLPGVGKTTLAQELLQNRDRVLEHFDGVLWANVGRVPHVKAELNKWALKLGYSVDQCNAFGTEDSVWDAAIRDRIGDRRMLVVLDDVFDAKVARRFVDLAPKSTFVLTTRQRSQVLNGVLPAPAEMREVPALGDDMARELLMALAPKAVADYPVIIQQLIDAVDGLPLALLLIGKYLANALREGEDRLKRGLERMQKAGERFKAMAEKANGGYLSMRKSSRSATTRWMPYRKPRPPFARSPSSAPSRTPSMQRSPGLSAAFRVNCSTT